MTNIALDVFGVTEQKGIPVASSRKVAEVFDKRHDHILRDIQQLTISLPKIGEPKWENNFIQSKYKNRGKHYPEYLLTKDGFTLVTMGFTGDKALKFKIAYINRFNEMETFIKNLLEAKAEFPEFTDAIMLAHEEPKHYHFSNECNMINTIVLGMTAKKYREINGIKSGKSIRPYLTPAQIEAVRTLQRIDIGLIVAIPDYQQRKQVLKRHYERLQQKKLIALA